jgi:hypothetical protein
MAITRRSLTGSPICSPAKTTKRNSKLTARNTSRLRRLLRLWRYGGKKFATDPEAWKIVDGKLYLNLDKDVQAEWEKDVSGNIRKADSIWPRIKDTPASDL